MTPADQKERDKRHVRSLQNPRIISTFSVCGVTIAEADRAELLGMICWLVKGSDAFRQQPKGKTSDFCENMKDPSYAEWIARRDASC